MMRDVLFEKHLFLEEYCEGHLLQFPFWNSIMSVRLTRNPRRIFVVGGHITKFIGSRHPEFIHKKHPDFGKIENPDLEWYVESAVNGTFEATGVPPQLIEKAWIGNFAGELFSKQVCALRLLIFEITFS